MKSPVEVRNDVDICLIGKRKNLPVECRSMFVYGAVQRESVCTQTQRSVLDRRTKKIGKHTKRTERAE